MKKILLSLLLATCVLSQTNAQTQQETAGNGPVITNSFWSNWYVQAGLDLTLLNPYGSDFSEVFPKGKLFGINVAGGKWFTPEVGLRLRLKWGNGFPLFKNDYLQWIGPTDPDDNNMDNGGFFAIYGDVQLDLLNIFKGYDDTRKWSLLVFPRAGYISNMGYGSSSPMVGVGVGTTYRLNERLSLYADFAYQVMTSEFFSGVSGTGMGVSAGSNGYFDLHVGVQWDLGKSKGKFKRLSQY